MTVRKNSCSTTSSYFCFNSRLTTHDPRLTTHDSRPTTHDPRLTTHDPRLTTHDSRLTTHDSRLTTHDPRPTTHDPRLMTNFPFFIAQRIRKPDGTSFSATVSKIGTVSIALGVAVGIVAFSVLLGFKETIKQKIFLFGAHYQVTKLSLNSSAEEAPLSLHSFVYDQKIDGIAHRQAVAHKAGILKTTDELQGAIIKGVGRDYDWAALKSTLIAGRVIQFADSGYSNEIILSNKIAKGLRLAVGQSVVMYFVQNPPRARKLKVVGIYETNVEEFDNQLIVGDISLIQKLNGWSKGTVGTIEFFVKDFAKIQSVGQNLKDKTGQDMRIESVVDRFPALFDWLNLLDQNTSVLMALILFVACFNIISVLLVMMMERTPMIGLLKTLGSPNAQIRKVFFYVGIQLTIKGLLLGNVIGLGLCFIQKYLKIMPLDPVNYYMNTVPIEINWIMILILNIATLLLIALILLIPTLVIGRIEPVKALRFRK
jgi:lipoprotein-releasing system permease protein